MKPFVSFEWLSRDIDEILVQGDYLYKFAKKSLMSLRSFLEPQDIPPFIHIDEKYLNWKVKKNIQWKYQ
jgi:hypothetical protein